MNTETCVEKKEEELPQTEHTRNSVTFRPAVDIVEDGEGLIVYADIPGSSQDQIEIDFEENALLINARVLPRTGEQRRYLTLEYGVGNYFRKFRVHENVDTSKITADYQNGVLVVRLPRAESAKPRKISVSARS